MNVLFICSANKDRSATAEAYFNELHPEYVYDSAGTNQKYCNQLGTQFVTVKMLNWADRIYVMEIKHQNFILKMNAGSLYHKISVLHISDHYAYGDPVLKQLLADRVSF
jgi:predicted protein tyrosine phosphatase